MNSTEPLYRIALDAEEAGNHDLALKSYERAASLGDAFSLFRLAHLYDVGELGVVQDKAEAMRLYRKAWRKGCPGAANNIAILYREQGKRRAMFEWFERDAKAGDAGAYVNMAKCYLAGTGVRKDLQAALRCLSAALNSDPASITDEEREEAKVLMATLRPRSV